MYLEHYGFLKEPFHITPDPDFLYLSPSHREALAALVYGVEQRKGFIALTGEVGVGKTTVLRAFMKRLEGKAVRPVYLFNPALTFRELLISVLRGLNVTPEPEKSTTDLLDQLNWLLIDEYRAGHNVVLIVDEAQNMPIETLEQTRMLSNVETSEDKLLQIILIGQPELDDKLNLHELRQLKQRCAVRAVVRPLTQDESADYIKHRLYMAGCSRDEVFSASAVSAIVHESKGRPRTINILCDNALIAGFGVEQEVVSAAIVRAVIRDMHSASRVTPSARWKWAAAFAAIGIVVGAVAAQLNLFGGSGTGHAVNTVEASAATPDTAVAPPAPAKEVTPAPVAAPVSAADAVGAALAQRLEGPTPPVEPAPAHDAMPVPDGHVEPAKVAEGQEPPRLSEKANAANAPVKSAELKPAVARPAESKKPTTAPPSETKAENKPAAPTKEAASVEVKHLNDSDRLTSRVIANGDCLSRLAREVYGSGDPAIVNALRSYNPQIENPDHILPGQTVVFPVAALVGAKTAAGGPANSAGETPSGGASQ